MKYKLAVFAILLQLSSPAQDYVDILTLGYGRTPETGYDSSPGTTRINHGDLTLFLPIPLSENTALITGAMGTTIRLSPDPASESMGLYNIGPLLGVNLVHDEKWTTRHILIPRLTGAFEYKRSRLQLATLQLLEKKITPNKTYGVGFYLNTEEYGTMFVPLISVFLRSANGLWEFNALLPSRGDINLKLNQKWRTGVVFDGLGSSFPIENEQFGKSYVQRNSNDISLYLQYRLTPSLIFSMRGGYSFSRAFSIYDSDDKVKISIVNIFFDDPRTVLNESVDEGYLFNFRFVYRFNLDKSGS